MGKTYCHTCAARSTPADSVNMCELTCAVVTKRLVCRHIGDEDGHACGCAVQPPGQRLGAGQRDGAETQRRDGIRSQHRRAEDVDASGVGIRQLGLVD